MHSFLFDYLTTKLRIFQLVPGSLNIIDHLGVQVVNLLWCVEGDYHNSLESSNFMTSRNLFSFWETINRHFLLRD